MTVAEGGILLDLISDVALILIVLYALWHIFKIMNNHNKK